MSASDLLTEQDKLQVEGQKILKKLNLIVSLSDFGEPQVVGSMELGTMTWRDIDIEVIVGNPSVEQLLSLTQEYLKHPLVRNVTTSNNIDYRIYPYYPEGVYFGLKTIEQNGEQWKIDVWLLKKDQRSAKDDLSWIKKGITEQRKIAILEIKRELLSHPRYRKELSAKDVYRAVIKHGAKSLEDFKKYLKQTNHPILL